MAGSLKRIVGLAGTAMVGMGLSLVFATPQGCVFPDTCIELQTPGEMVCKGFTNAADGVGNPILEGGISFPEGCLCADSDQVTLLFEGDPNSDEHKLLMAELDAAARQACLVIALDQDIADHNCMTADEVIGDVINKGPSSACAGMNCEYINPPADGSCPDECGCHIEFGCIPGDTDGDTDGGAGSGADGSGGATDSGGGVTPGGSPF